MRARSAKSIELAFSLESGSSGRQVVLGVRRSCGAANSKIHCWESGLYLTGSPRCDRVVVPKHDQLYGSSITFVNQVESLLSREQ
jgi:hypothetical protein